MTSILTKAEQSTIYGYLLTAREPRDIFLQILFETGCRVSEALHMSADSLTVHGLAVKPLKNSNPRTVEISDNLRLKLQSLPPDWRRTIGEGARSSQRRALTRHWHTVSEQQIGRRVRLHILRHTAFSRLYVATKDLLLVKQWAGHKSINSTMVYMHLDSESEANRHNSSLLAGL